MTTCPTKTSRQIPSPGRLLPRQIFLGLLVCLFALGSTGAASAAGEVPPSGCSNCGNYLRYGYIASDLAGWSQDFGTMGVQLVSPVPVRDEYGNVVQATTAGQSRISQSFEVAGALLGASEGPHSFFVQLDIRFIPGGSGFEPVNPALTLTVLRGNQQIFSQVVSKSSLTNSQQWHRLSFPGTLSGTSFASNQFTVRAQVDSTRIQVDNLGFWMPNSVNRPGLCAPAALTATGARVDEMLGMLSSGGQNLLSSRANCNSLPGAQDPFGRGTFLLSNPVVTGPSTTYWSEQYFQAIADELRKTTSTFYLSSLNFDLSAPTGASLPEMYLEPALADLHARFYGVPVAFQPSVQILLSPGAISSSTYPSAADLYAEITQGLPGALNFKLAVGEIGVVYLVDWNHTKVAIRDRRYAVAGGQNWSSDYLTVDGDGQTLHDLNLRLEGDGARAAAKMFETLWARKAAGTCAGTVALCGPTNPIVNPLPEQQYDSSNVFSLGRGHLSPSPSSSDFDRSADFAAYAALAGATEKIRISQHMMLPESGLTTALSQALFSGAEIEAVVSPPWSSPPPKVQLELLAGGIFSWGHNHGYSAAEKQNALCRLHFAAFATPVDGLHRTHAKFWMVDDEAFYVGSQNMYPSAFGDAPADLNEYGFLIDGAGQAGVALQQFWNPVWAAASLDELSVFSLDCDAPAIEATPEPSVLQGSPGEIVTAAVSLLNRGDFALDVDVELMSDSPWLSVTPASGLIGPQDTLTVQLKTTCPTTPVSRLGRYRVTDSGGREKIFTVENTCANYRLEPRPLILAAQVNEVANGLWGLTNLGGSSLDYSFLAPSFGLGISPSSGSVAASEMAPISVSFTCPSRQSSHLAHATLQVQQGGTTTSAPVSVRIFCVDPGGGGWGDPHNTTYDGAKYDFQATGQYVLTRGELAGGQHFEVQVRQRQAANQVAVIAAVALEVGSHRLIFEDRALYLDNELLLLEPAESRLLAGGGEVLRDGDRYQVIWPNGDTYVSLVSRFSGQLGAYYNVEAHPVGVTNLQGLLGNHNGNPADDFVLRDGTELTQLPLSFADLYGSFAYGQGPKGDPLGWVIRDASESLFYPHDGIEPADQIDEAFPSAIFTSVELDPQVRIWAYETCAAAGVIEPGALEACLVDVGSSQDPALAEDALEAQGAAGAAPALFACSSEWQPGWCQHLMDGLKGTCNTGEWASNQQATPTAKIYFPTTRQVSGITLWDRACPEDVLDGYLLFSDGTTVDFDALDETGTTLTFPTRSASWVEIHLTATQGGAGNPGLGEVEFQFD